MDYKSAVSYEEVVGISKLLRIKEALDRPWIALKIADFNVKEPGHILEFNCLKCYETQLNNRLKYHGWGTSEHVRKVMEFNVLESLSLNDKLLMYIAQCKGCLTIYWFKA